MEINENVWAFFQAALGYDDEEMAEFRQNPKSRKLITRAGAIAQTTFTAEVVEAHGCFSGHKPGQRIILDGAGNLLPEHCPPRLCVYLLNNLGALVFAAQELIYAGADPKEMMFNRCACIDVGRVCGGLGRVVLELRADSGAGIKNDE